VSNLSFFTKTQNDFRFNRQKNYSLLQTDSKKDNERIVFEIESVRYRSV
jgi:hypothetical protein